MLPKVLESYDEILAACGGGEIVIVMGEELPRHDPDDGLVVCKVSGEGALPSFFVIGLQAKRFEVQETAKNVIEEVIGGTITSFRKLDGLLS